MQHYEIEPPAALRDTVESFWYLQKDFEEFPASFEVLPDGYAEVIFYFGSAHGVATPGNAPLVSPFLVGLLNQPLVFQLESRLEVIGIRCFPWAVFELLDLPSTPEGVRMMQHPIAQLQAPLAQLVQAGQIPAALARVEQYCVQARSRMASDELLHKAGAALRQANGTLSVRQVAAAAYATVRTLERRFKQSAGSTVKDVAGLMRFEQALNHLLRHPEANLAALALEMGYTDQSHLGREFKRYSGTTPAAFARKVKQANPTVSDDFVAFLLT